MLGLAILAIAVSLLRIGADIVSAHKDGGDLATWAGAFGAIGALFFAIWLAFSDSRRARAAAHQEAVIVCASIGLNVAGAVVRLKALSEQLSEAVDDREVTLASLIHAGDVLRRANLWTYEDARKIVPLPKNCAEHLTFGLTQYLMLVGMLSNAAQNELLQRAETRIVFAKDTIGVIEHMSVSLSLAQQEMQSASKHIYASVLEMYEGGNRQS